VVDKPSLTYKQQLDLMKKKGIVIEDENLALEVIQSVSYYGIVNGYKDIFETYKDENGFEKFTNEVSFVALHRIFLIDQTLNNFLFKYIIYIEKSLKTKLAYKIAHKYSTDINKYLDFNCYRSHSVLDRVSVVSSIKNQIETNKNSAAIQHYRDNHDTIPPWVATSGIYFGTVINWYKICHDDIKEYIANQFFSRFTISSDNAKEMLVAMLSLLQEYRNNIAHGNRTFLSKVTNELTKDILLSMFASSKDILNEEEYLQGIGQKDLFAVMLSIATLINDPLVFKQFISDFQAIFNIEGLSLDSQYSPRGNIYETLNIPDDSLNRLKNIFELKFKKDEPKSI
jgi:abi-like protein